MIIFLLAALSGAATLEMPLNPPTVATGAISLPPPIYCRWRQCGYLKDVGLLCSNVVEQCDEVNIFLQTVVARKGGAVIYSCDEKITCEK